MYLKKKKTKRLFLQKNKYDLSIFNLENDCIELTEKKKNL